MMKVLPVATLARWVGPDSASALAGPPAGALVSEMIDEHRRRDDFSLFNAEGRAGLLLIGSHPPPVVMAPLVAWCAGEFRAGRSVFSNAGLLFGHALDPLVDPVDLLDDVPPGAVLLIECGEREAAGADDLALRAAAVAHHSDVLVIALADAHSAALSAAARPSWSALACDEGLGASQIVADPSRLYGRLASDPDARYGQSMLRSGPMRIDRLGWRLDAFCAGRPALLAAWRAALRSRD